MAQKRIKMIKSDILSDRLRILYDDGSQGELNLEKSKNPVGPVETLVGLTRKQAKKMLGIKD